ncbi:MAG: adenine-specific DNA-methyltransferase [Acidobacteriota bacterium]|jgi:adenine-specific DNA-methyltransferase|nr:adenine-specific DNA-methyltransferase [Acidobacteriota bacterium]
MNLTPFSKFREILGEPYYYNDGCLIYNLDCLAAMQALPDALVHLTVTSPPYNIGKEYEEPLPLEHYLEWCGSWLNEVHRITIVNGAFWLNLGYVNIPGCGKAIPLPYLIWNKSPFYFIQEIVWNYSAGIAGKIFFSPRNEKFLWYVKTHDEYTFNLDEVRDPNVKYPNQKKNGKIKVNPLGKNPTDVWQIPKVTSGRNRSSKERTPHPAQFPVTVVDRIIRATSNKEEVILDPFMGSGTTVVAALNLQRYVVGFELKEEYCEIAAKRIENYLGVKQLEGIQQRMFEENLSHDVENRMESRF